MESNNKSEQHSYLIYSMRKFVSSFTETGLSCLVVIQGQVAF